MCINPQTNTVRSCDLFASAHAYACKRLSYQNTIVAVVSVIVVYAHARACVWVLERGDMIACLSAADPNVYGN